MRQSKQVGLLLALFFLSVSQAGAWEFSMSGNFTWEFYQFSQLGSNGFFGPFNQDNSFSGRHCEARCSQRLAWSRDCQSRGCFYFG